MTTFKTLVFSAVIGSASTSLATAGQVIGTEKARGHFGGFGWTQLHEGRQHVDHGHRAVRYQSQPAIVQSTIVAPAAAPTTVAQAPTEGRRFSYAPSTDAAVSQPAATVATSSVQPMTVQPTYSRATHHRHSVDKWALQKTDPRKYSSR